MKWELSTDQYDIGGSKSRGIGLNGVRHVWVDVARYKRCDQISRKMYSLPNTKKT
jgi:hypothetical protein